MSIVQIYDQTVPYVSGYSMRSRYITDSLTALGVKIRVISSPIFPYTNSTKDINGAKYIRSHIPHWDMVRRFPLIKEGRVVKAICQKTNESWEKGIGLVDAHSSVLNGYAGLQVARQRKVPFLYEIRALWEDAAVDQGKTSQGSLRYNLTRWLETKVVNEANHVTVICDGLKNDLIGRGVSPKKITVIPNGVDTQSFQPQKPDPEIIDRYGLENCIVFGFIGTFFHFEGLELFLKAIKQILIRHKDVRFLFVGGGHQENHLKEMVAEMGLSKYVIFTGRVRHEEIKKYYSVIEILVYPRISKRITELVTPLKPLEAMAMEKIVIGSNVGGLKELIQDRYNGLLFQSGDACDLADKCLSVIAQKNQMMEMAQTARKHVIRERNWLEICKKYLDLFNKLGVQI